MRAYLTYFSKSFKKNAAYRASVWLQIVASLVTISIQVTVWTVLIGSGSVDGITRDDMVTYSIINAAMFAFTITSLFRDVDTRLRSGDIGIDLLRPIRYPLLILADQLGRSAYRVVFIVVPIVVLSSWAYGFSAPSSPLAGLSFVLVLMLSVLISFSIGYLIALLSFWFLTTFHFSWAIGSLTTLFSGAVLPLWFFPDTWARVASALPFQFLGFVPAATWMGQLAGIELLRVIGVGVGWCAVLLGLTIWLWNRATAQLVVQGG